MPCILYYGNGHDGRLAIFSKSSGSVHEAFTGNNCIIDIDVSIDIYD